MLKICTPVSLARRFVRALFIDCASVVPRVTAVGPLATIAGARPMLGTSQTTMLAAPLPCKESTMFPMSAANCSAVAVMVAVGSAPPAISARALRALLPPPATT